MSSRKASAGPWLLDVNVLLSVLWPAHSLHAKGFAWFAAHRAQGWATCPLTEAGFVRVVSNPMFSRDAPSIAEATELLATSKASGGVHYFWPADLPWDRVMRNSGLRVSGHQQVTDAYLLALAVRHNGKLVTFDSRVHAVAAADSAEAEALAVLKP